jgi:hypothetical protein
VPFSWAQLAAGRLPHSGPRSRTPPRSSSLHQAGKEASATLPPDGAACGLIYPHYNHNMEGERSSHDKVSPADAGAMARNQPPLRVASCSPRRTTDASLCSASHRRERISVTMKPPRRQADRYRGPARRTTSARACAQEREDLDGGLHPHSGPCQGVDPSSS